MQASSTTPLRALVVICLATAGWGFSFGVSTQATSLWLHGAGQSDTAIGINTATYYLGIALASALVPWLMRRGGAACVGGGMALSGTTLALFPWGGSPAVWLALRLLQGAGTALSLIPLETYVSEEAGPAHRSRNLGFYTVALSLGAAVGIAAGMHLYALSSSRPFYVAGAVVLMCGLVVGCAVPRLGRAAARQQERTALALGRNFLSYGSAWSQGFLEGGMFAFLPLYLLSVGLSAEGAGNMMGVAVVGVLLFQVPVAWLADRLGTTPVLLSCYAVTAVGLAVMPFCSPGPWLGVWLFLIGAGSGAFYPLGLALLGERMPASGLARAYACYMAMECLGSIMGPVCMGPARTWSGERAMFVVGELALLLVVLSWVVLHLLRPRRVLPNSCPESCVADTTSRGAA